MALSLFRWLFVIARNSSFTYKGRSVDVKQVGRELGVRYILEGSVRKAGNRIRIAGQLIDAETGAHLWADHFDGALRGYVRAAGPCDCPASLVQSPRSCSVRTSSGPGANQPKIWMRTTITCAGWRALVGGPRMRTSRHSSSFARQSSSTVVWPARMAWLRGATSGKKRMAGWMSRFKKALKLYGWLGRRCIWEKMTLSRCARVDMHSPL